MQPVVFPETGELVIEHEALSLRGGLYARLAQEQEEEARAAQALEEVAR